MCVCVWRGGGGAITEVYGTYIILIITCILGRTYFVERSIHLIEEH